MGWKPTVAVTVTGCCALAFWGGRILRDQLKVFGATAHAGDFVAVEDGTNRFGLELVKVHPRLPERLTANVLTVATQKWQQVQVTNKFVRVGGTEVMWSGGSPSAVYFYHFGPTSKPRYRIAYPVTKAEAEGIVSGDKTEFRWFVNPDDANEETVSWKRGKLARAKRAEKAGGR